MPEVIENREFLDKLLAGDPKCKYPIGTKVKKVKGEEGDYHPLGVKGIVYGSMFHENLGGAYLVKFHSDEPPTFLVEEKIGLDE